MNLAARPFLIAASLTMLLCACVNTDKMRASDPMVKEVDKLSIPIGAALIEPCRYGVKSSSHRLYSCYFHAKSNFQELLAFYSRQLEATGWHLADQEQVRDWGRDLGGKTATFCKKDLRLVLQFAGERASDDWQYAFTATSVGCG